MKIRASKRDYLWSFFAYILKFGINLFVFPLVLTILDSAEYGLWVTFSSVTTIINLFDFGFSSTLLRNVTYVWSGSRELHSEGCDSLSSDAQRDKRLFLLTIETCKRIYIILASIAFIFSVSLGTLYIGYVIRNIYKSEYLIAWLISVLGITINFYSGYWGVLLKGIGAIKQTQKANIAGYLIQLIISHVGLWCGFGLISLSLANVICGMTIRFVSYYYFEHYEDVKDVLQSKLQFTKEEIKETFKTVWYNARKAGISSIASVLMTQSTTMLCSAFLGVEITGEYGICLQILNTLNAVSQIFYQTSIPEITQFRQYGNVEKCRKRLSISLCIAWGVFVFGVIFCVFAGNYLLRVIHSQTQLNLYIFLLVAYYSFGEMNYSINANYISLGNHLPFVPSVVITSCSTVLLSMIGMYFHLGIWGLLLIRCITESLYIFWKWPAVVNREMSLNPLKIIKIGFTEIRVYVSKELSKNISIDKKMLK